MKWRNRRHWGRCVCERNHCREEEMGKWRTKYWGDWSWKGREEREREWETANRMGRNGRKGRDKERSRNAVGGGEQEPNYGVNGVGLLRTSGGLAPRTQFADRNGAGLLYTTRVRSANFQRALSISSSWGFGSITTSFCPMAVMLWSL